MKLKTIAKYTCLVYFLLVLQTTVFSDVFKKISNPAPTVVEGDFVRMKEVAAIEEDLGNDEYLFYPRTLAVDNNSLLIYDVAQTKILKFDNHLKLIKSWGRKGNGPGEFAGYRYAWFELSVGKDGNIYTNDFRARRIQAFDKNGIVLRTIRYTKRWRSKSPLVDENGNILFATIQDGKIKIFNEKNECMIQFEKKDEYLSYLFYLPEPRYRKNNIDTGDYEILLRYTLDSKILVFFQDSSTMAVVKPDGAVTSLKLWPKNALIQYKKDLTELRVPKPGGFDSIPHKPMFVRFFVDADNKEFFYLQLATKRQNGKIPAYLYQFDLNGTLQKILHIPFAEQKATSVRFIAKKNNRFYSIQDGETINIYQEVTQ